MHSPQDFYNSDVVPHDHLDEVVVPHVHTRLRVAPQDFDGQPFKVRLANSVGVLALWAMVAVFIAALLLIVGAGIYLATQPQAGLLLTAGFGGGLFLLLVLAVAQGWHR